MAPGAVLYLCALCRSGFRYFKMQRFPRQAEGMDSLTSELGSYVGRDWLSSIEKGPGKLAGKTVTC